MRPNFKAILLDIDDGIATVTLNRPEALNAYNEALQQDLLSVFDLIDEEDSIRAVIVTGAGRAFCAGADLSGGASSFEFEATDEDRPLPQGGSADHSRKGPRDGGGLVTLRIFRCLKPVIAAVNGPAVGIGATMQLAMDVRIAADNAKFGFVFTRRGIVPEAASSWFLPRLVGISRSLEWCISGRPIPAAEALDAGLIRSMHPPEELMSAARQIANELIAQSAPVSVALTRQMLWRGLGLDHPIEAHKVDSELLYQRARSADVKEGVNSFLEKRKAIFPDRVSEGMPAFFPWWKERTFH